MVVIYLLRVYLYSAGIDFSRQDQTSDSDMTIKVDPRAVKVKQLSSTQFSSAQLGSVQLSSAQLGSSQLSSA